MIEEAGEISMAWSFDSSYTLTYTFEVDTDALKLVRVSVMDDATTAMGDH